ncbi:DUF1236 domain-containing protein [Lutimaribacter sp. EGI FJ00015]|uniref:DUF1236 domain-containing protein n=1 Tax=Lutimaribacter degradans TaxID=2945989 RepID=A0ACC5ZTX1_9RHOB|nr:DUF1236 domain-containing protein [Lutimaribacter sp. EGI FJ00013]MCM2561625.1 DUF1236 domain-containing protein [Lutimaribacter sp. EGI FJ00013]MCO0612664.1 DUF1236 domain-containing protein [Lutimaribacter sp. EGI FJ00015]MCO0635322.1 DUF1236 domain-containing protein [Lutimaribacter sp. EGI FJ00014]
MTIKLTLGTTLAGLVLATSAFAETTATAWTDLNLRAGPNTTYDIISVIPAAQSVVVDGCLDESNWCRVTHGEINGWASGDYLTAMVEAPIAGNRERLAVKSVTYEKDPGAAVGSGAVGAVAGAAVGGPVGALIGAAIGASAGSAATPTDKVTTYVRANPLDPVYLDGEVVVGAGIPETVTLSEVPDSEYHYAYVNGVPVLVEREKRRVVYIVR